MIGKYDEKGISMKNLPTTRHQLTQKSYIAQSPHQKKKIPIE
jgi:hypothetical protein